LSASARGATTGVGLITSTTFSTFTFTFKNFQYNNGAATLGIDLDTGCRYISNGGNTGRFLFHYRVEEYDNTQIYINPDSTDSTRITTLWVDGNSSYGSTNVGGAAVISSDITNPQNIDGGNYATPSDNTIVRNPSSTVYNIVGNDLVIKVDNTIFIQSNDNKCYVYGRIGLPMTANYSFEYVTCQLTT
jgi:hypothetical protein